MDPVGPFFFLRHESRETVVGPASRLGLRQLGLMIGPGVGNGPPNLLDTLGSRVIFKTKVAG